ncbi:MAG TPA: hypothetical protein VFA60_06945 [Terriglobales bacterium]|nr:hypothetical protein [Terriglobales bacterium]
MTEALKKVFDEITKLPPEEQDEIASVLAQELASERKWDDLFAKSQGSLAKLADDAWAEHQRGETIPLDKFLKAED